MEKKDVLIIVLCLIGLFSWFMNQSRYVPTMPPPNAPTDTAPTDDSQAVNDAHSIPSIATESDISKRQMNVATEFEDLGEYQDIPAADPVLVSFGDYADFTVDPELGGITECSLHRYKDVDAKNVMRLGIAERPMLNLQSTSTPWQFSNSKIESVTETNLTISKVILGTGLILQQTWEIDSEREFGIKYDIKIRNNGNTPIELINVFFNTGVMEPLDSAKQFMGAGGIDQRVDFLISGKDSPKTVNSDKVKKYDSDDEKELRHRIIDWLAVQNKYFTTVVTGEQPIPGCRLEVVKLGGGDETEPDSSVDYLVGAVYLPDSTLAVGQERQWKFNYFIGPKRYSLLKDFESGVESILQFDLFLFFHFDWMKAISLGILWSLNKLESVFHNYGVAIIIITIVIRILFWPVTHRTTVWSKKMQEVQPLALKIREKYKNEPQKLQQKTMELYREHKINPLAGCLPMFLQIPVFFALFNVLRSAIELRHAEFLWVHDLSQQDSIFFFPGLSIPLNPLAILMGVTMFWQQKIVPTSADPAQQKMMMFMTIFFVVILYTMPSGLTLYWTINQIASIFQYKVTRNVNGVSTVK